MLEHWVLPEAASLSQRRWFPLCFALLAAAPLAPLLVLPRDVTWLLVAATSVGLVAAGWWWSRANLLAKYEGARAERNTLNAALARLEDANEELARQLAQYQQAQAEWAEQAKLEGFLLAVRTIEHELSNNLCVTAGYVELLSEDPSLSPHLCPAALEAVQGVMAAINTVRRLKQIALLHETDWGPGLASTLDIPRSLD